MNLLRIFFRRIKTAIRNPNWIFIRLLVATSPIFRDDVYLKLLFSLRTGYKLNLSEPRTFNEKLQWLKINYRKSMLTKMADKYEAKIITEKKLGKDHVVKTFGVWDSFDQIEFEKLPKQFVLKTTHDQGGIVICKDKSVFNFKKAEQIIEKHLNNKNYYITREWPYKNVKPRVMAEQFLENIKKGDLWDYKFYCFHGEPKVMYIAMGRQGDHVPLYFYDMDFNLLDIKRPNHQQDDKILEKPKNWDKMKELARISSSGLPHVRVDFYSIDDNVYSGEYTFFQGGGMMPFIPKKWDDKFGEWIDLNKCY